jgi:hypothetical protein
VRQKQQHTAAATDADSSSGGLQTSNSTHRWEKPGLSEVKCNVDAAIFKEQGCYGVGMCLRDVNGKFIVAKTAWFYGIPQPQEA